MQKKQVKTEEKEKNFLDYLTFWTKKQETKQKIKKVDVKITVERKKHKVAFWTYTTLILFCVGFQAIPLLTMIFIVMFVHLSLFLWGRIE